MTGPQIRCVPERTALKINGSCAYASHRAWCPRNCLQGFAMSVLKDWSLLALQAQELVKQPAPPWLYLGHSPPSNCQSGASRLEILTIVNVAYNSTLESINIWLRLPWLSIHTSRKVKLRAIPMERRCLEFSWLNNLISFYRKRNFNLKCVFSHTEALP